MCALVECSTVIPVTDDLQKFGHSSNIIFDILLIRRNVGRGRILKRNLVGKDAGNVFEVFSGVLRQRQQVSGLFCACRPWRTHHRPPAMS